MQAYQSAPCPYCGVTWNPPGSQACGNCRNLLPAAPPAFAPPGYLPPGYGPSPAAAYPQQQYASYPPPAPVALAAAGPSLTVLGQSITLPFTIPAALLPYRRYLLVGPAAAAILGVILLGVTPAIAATQLRRASQALKVTRAHQPAVDAGFSKFFTSGSASNDPNLQKKALEQQARTFSDALSSVQADEAALRSADQALSLLQPVTPTKKATIAAERHQISVALAGLAQADTAMTAAVNESNVALPYIDALIDYAKMGAALGKHDLAGAGAPFPDAQQKLELAMSLDHAAGVAPAIARQVSSFNDAVNSTEALIQAIQAKDAAAIKKANDAVQAALKAMSSPAETVSADYESKTFSPMQKAYDGAIKSLAS